MIYLENDTSIEFDFDFNEIANSVVDATLKELKCPFECEVDILLTDNASIHEYNLETRNIDRPTDVLSYPNLFFEEEGIYEMSLNDINALINPENNKIVLGQIIISLEKVIEQADEFGHSKKREFAFLVAHSMLHLSGYDHMEKDEAQRMENMQRVILDKIGLTRDC